MYKETLVGGVPFGAEPFFLSETLSTQGSSVSSALYIVPDQQTLLGVLPTLKALLPSWDVLAFPAWDHTPYERVSPALEVVETRLSALSALLSTALRPRLVVVTPMALAGYTLPPALLRASMLVHTPDAPLRRKAILSFLEALNYQHVSMVQNVGEYSVRGGIIDAHFVGHQTPLRLDFFDEDLESIKAFEADMQTTTSTVDAFCILPASEVILTEDTKTCFREAYRKQAGAKAYTDPFYESVSEGVLAPGIETFLPLFYETPGTLFSYLPPETHIFYSVRSLDTLDIYIDKLKSAHTFRKKQPDQAPGLLLPVSDVLMDRKTVNDYLSTYIRYKTSPFQVKGAVDYGARPTPFLGKNSTKKERLRTFQDVVSSTKKPIFISTDSDAETQAFQPELKRLNIKTETSSTLSKTADPKFVHFIQLAAMDGFEHKAYTLFPLEALTGKVRKKKRPSQQGKGKELFEISAFNVGDFLIHEEHGVGRYLGLETIQIQGAKHDCVMLEYQDNAKLFVPVENFYTLSFYASRLNDTALDRLGGASWQRRREAAQKKIMEIAEKLADLAAKRKLLTAESFPMNDFFDRFCEGFPYPETDDQLRAIEDVVSDLQATTPMDRLVCGDVGFGKTEVALRAAFIVASSGAQVAFLAPTTILAKQHYETLKARFEGFDVKIGFLSRFQTAKETKDVFTAVKSGEIDIVVGTHALLSGKLSFFKLGLLIVDEEQHFGVKQKEAIKGRHPHVHILSLSATPIPRTMQMAVSGIRDLSLIATPPTERMPVETWVVPYDLLTVKEALTREKNREGQSFVVCPRVSDIPDILHDLKVALPDLNYGVAHGQLPPRELEQIMMAFCEGQIDVLVATNIIESGLDIPKANTIIIHRSDLFGLAQIYQLRGRVGRSHIQGYAYFTFNAQKSLSDNATKRLEVLESLKSLGGGFQIASYDMDIRGTGNIVGEAQSGQIKNVGVGLYHQMLEESLLALKNHTNTETWDLSHWVPQIHLGLEIMIPAPYIQDESLRFRIYRRLSALKTKDEIQSFFEEMVDRFGPVPTEFRDLMATVELRNLCKQLNIQKIDRGPKGILISFYKDQFHNIERLMSLVNQEKGSVKLRPDQKVVIFKKWNQDVLIQNLIHLLRRLLPDTPEINLQK